MVAVKSIPKLEALSPIQIQAISLLIAGKKSKDVAEALDVTPQTLVAWNKQSLFMVTLNRLKLEIVESARDSIRSIAAKAVDCLSNLITEEANGEVRRKAAIDILQMAGVAGSPDKRNPWGIGPTTLKELQQQQSSQRQLDDLFAQIK